TPFGQDFMDAYNSIKQGAQYKPAGSPPRELTFNFDYALSAPPIADLEGVQHNVSTSFGIELSRGFTVGLFAGYGFTGGASINDVATNIHRISYGLEGAWSARIGQSSFTLGPVLRVGSQTNLIRNSDGVGCPDPSATFCGDLSSFRGEAALQTTFHGYTTGLFLRGGASLDAVRFTDAAGNELEQPRLSPFLSLGVQF
ncbi:MAG: hypothetical protein AAGI01_18485, partial [Myxococcota bacterium]